MGTTDLQKAQGIQQEDLILEVEGFEKTQVTHRQAPSLLKETAITLATHWGNRKKEAGSAPISRAYMSIDIDRQTDRSIDGQIDRSIFR